MGAYIIFNINTIRFSALLTGVWQSLMENLYKFIAIMLGQQNSQKHVIRFFPLVYTLFVFILFANVLGLFPYAFTVTSHICVTFILAFIMFFGLTFFGIHSNKFNFLKFFIPSGVPVFLVPFLVLIELISYFIRPFSLSIRLFANMLSGHTLLYILGSFASGVLGSTPGFFLLPFLSLILVFLLEFAIAFIQTYVFVILTCIYFNDMYNVNVH